MLLWDALV
jgi:hypothetical protein